MNDDDCVFCKGEIGLRELMLAYITRVLNLNGGNRTITSESLKISVRGMRNYINEINKNAGIKPIKDSTYNIKENETPGTPTNKQRLKYRDEMLNRNSL